MNILLNNLFCIFQMYTNFLLGGDMVSEDCVFSVVNAKRLTIANLVVRIIPVSFGY